MFIFYKTADLIFEAAFHLSFGVVIDLVHHLLMPVCFGSRPVPVIDRRAIAGDDGSALGTTPSVSFFPLSAPLKLAVLEVEVFSNFKTQLSGMKQSKFTESQIVAAIKQQEAGMPVKDVARSLGISEATFYNWKAKYGGMEASDVKRVKDLEAELSQYKKMYAELSFEHQALKNVMAKKW
jgi:putative transposase